MKGQEGGNKDWLWWGAEPHYISIRTNIDRKVFISFFINKITIGMLLKHKHSVFT